MSAEDIPQSVVRAAVKGLCTTYGTVEDHTRAALAAALAEYEKQGYHLTTKEGADG